MATPVLIAVDDRPTILADVDRELRARYSHHYRVEALDSAAAACALIGRLADAGEEVALVLARRGLPDWNEIFDRTRQRYRHARRGLLIEWESWGAPTTGRLLLDALAHGRIDDYLLLPSETPDEFFHQGVSNMLHEWRDSWRVSPQAVYVVGKSWTGRANELRELLGRCALPHTFCLADSPQGRELLGDPAEHPSRFPVVVLPDGRMLVDPTNIELAEATGSPAIPARSRFDLVIVGAGPAGLSAAVYGASEGFSTLVVDEGGLGGQATSSSLIRNYLGFPRGVSGRRLAQRAYEQSWIFGAEFAFMQRVVGLRRVDGELEVTLSDGGPVRAQAVLLSSGARYRRLGVPELEELNGAGVFYGGTASEGPAMSGRDVFVLGGANSAGQAALYLARFARSVTLVVRADSLEAGMSHYLIREIEASPTISVRLATEVVGGGSSDGWLDHLVLRSRHDGSEETVPAQALFMTIGANPDTAWLPDEVECDERGFLLTGADLPDGAWPLEREPFPLETSMPGVFAAGDARHGSVKRVASAVGEGSIAIQLLHRLFALDDAGCEAPATSAPAASTSGSAAT